MITQRPIPQIGLIIPLGMEYCWLKIALIHGDYGQLCRVWGVYLQP